MVLTSMIVAMTSLWLEKSMCCCSRTNRSTAVARGIVFPVTQDRNDFSCFAMTPLYTGKVNNPVYRPEGIGRLWKLVVNAGVNQR